MLTRSHVNMKRHARELFYARSLIFLKNIHLIDNCKHIFIFFVIFRLVMLHVMIQQFLF